MDNNIIKDLKGENSSAFGDLYKAHFAIVKRFVLNNNGHLNDAEDLFQDTMIVLLEKLRQDNFVLTASIKTYIMAIAKNLWLKKLRNPYHTLEYTEVYDNQFLEEISNQIEQEKNYFEKLQGYLHKITEHCKGLTHDMFFKNKAIEQIQKEYGYSSRHNAQNQKHKCIEQIRRVKEQDNS